MNLTRLHLVSGFPEKQTLLFRNPSRSRRKILTLLTPVNPLSKEISRNSASFFTTCHTPGGALHPWSPSLGKWHKINQHKIIPSAAQHDEKARVPRRFSTALLAAAAVSESFFGRKRRSLICFARSKRFETPSGRSASANPPEPAQ